MSAAGSGGRHQEVPEGPAAWLTRLGPLAVGRPPPSLGRAVAGAGGALVAVGAVTLAGNRWASSGSIGLAVLLTGGLLAGSAMALVRSPPPVQVAAVAASGIAAPSLAFFVSAGGGLPSVAEVAVGSALLLGALYLVGPGRGHTFHLAILVVAGWLFAVSLNDLSLSGAFVGGFDTLGDIVTGVGVASVVVGALYLLAGWWLHASGLEGMATPFLAVGIVALPLGTFAVLRDAGDVVGGLTAVVVGAALGLLGDRSGRRGTTWIGVGLVVPGVLAVVDGVAPDEAAVTGLLIAAAGAALVLLAPLTGAGTGKAAVESPPVGTPPAPDSPWRPPEPPGDRPEPPASRGPGRWT